MGSGWDVVRGDKENGRRPIDILKVIASRVVRFSVYLSLSAIESRRYVPRWCPYHLCSLYADYLMPNIRYVELNQNEDLSTFP